MISSQSNDIPVCSGFEGPEKLFEIWFHADGGERGLRDVPLNEWKSMLRLVKCDIINQVYHENFDAYLLR
jgi:hypothetical protein